VAVRHPEAVPRRDLRVKVLRQSVAALDLQQKNLYNRKVVNFQCHLIIQVGWHSQFLA
jgi:hypothetical protein